MSEYKVLQPTDDDVLALAKMHSKSWIDAYPNDEYGVSREFIEEHIKKLTTEKGLSFRHGLVKEQQDNPDYYLRVAKDKNDLIVGFVDARRGEEPELCGLYIDESTYGSGLARQLAEPVMEWLGRERDIKLTVVAYNLRAQAFYKKLGFEVVPGSDKFHNNTPLPVIDMIRKGDKS
jgi:RimJ/RimL family protein N-acetyltransferase